MKKEFWIMTGFAFIGWVLCAATMGIGMTVTSIETTLIIHAIAAPCFFAVLSTIYFSRFHFLSPLKTAVYFLTFVMVVDFFVVALLINRNLEMFTSILGTWLPFTLIFLSTWITGEIVTRQKKTNR